MESGYYWIKIPGGWVVALYESHPIQAWLVAGIEDTLERKDILKIGPRIPDYSGVGTPVQIKSINWNYGRNPRGQVIHLIRLKNGQGLLRTTPEMLSLGLLRRML